MPSIKLGTRDQRIAATYHPEHSPHFTDTCEVRTDQTHLLSSQVLIELQDQHNPDLFNDIDDELEGLSICESKQNADYDKQFLNDAAALWLLQAGL